MQSFSKDELNYVLEVIQLASAYYKAKSSCSIGLESTLASLRAVHLTVFANKMHTALESGNKRIEIRYYG